MNLAGPTLAETLIAGAVIAVFAQAENGLPAGDAGVCRITAMIAPGR